MKLALVTGSAGFVGRHLCPALEEAGYEVHGYDLKNGGVDAFLKSEKADWRWDVVVHLAANVVNIHDRMNGDLDAFDDIALDLRFCKWVLSNPPTQAFVALSSCAVSHPVDSDPYCTNKQVLEKFCAVLHRKGVPTVILRPYSGYGSDQSLHYPFRSILQRAMLKHDPLTVWGDLQTTRDWLHIEDFVAGILWAIDKAPRGVPVELGTGRGMTFEEVARTMAEEVGYTPAIKALTNKAAGASHRVSDPSLANQHGWKASISFREGVKRALASTP